MSNKIVTKKKFHNQPPKKDHPNHKKEAHITKQMHASMMKELATLRSEMKSLRAKTHKENPSAKALKSVPREAEFLKAEMLEKQEETKFISRLLGMWFDPEDAVYVRPGSQQALPTALRSTKDSFPVLIAPVAGVQCAQVFLFRNPFRAVLAKINAGGFVYKLNGRRIINEADTLPNSETLVVDSAVSAIHRAQYFQFDRAVYSSGTKVHGSNLYPLGVEAEPVQFFFVDGLSSLKITYAFPATTRTVNFYSYRIVNGNVVMSGEPIIVNANAGYVTIYAANGIPAYVGFSITMTAVDTPSGTWTLSPIIEQTVASINWGHFSAADLDTELLKMGKLRGIAASARITNSTADLYKDGIMTCVQTSGDMNWIDVATSQTPFDDIRRKAGALMPVTAKNGCYVPYIPDGAEDFEFEKMVDRNGTGINWVKIPFHEEDNFIALCINCSNTSVLTCTFTLGWEYQSTSQTADIKPSLMDYDVVMKALKRVKFIPRYYENPTHVKEVAKWVWSAMKKGFNFAVKAAPILYQAGSLISSLA